MLIQQTGKFGWRENRRDTIAVDNDQLLAADEAVFCRDQTIGDAPERIAHSSRRVIDVDCPSSVHADSSVRADRFTPFKSLIFKLRRRVRRCVLA